MCFGLLSFIVFPGSKKFPFADARSCSSGGGRATPSSILSAVTGSSAGCSSESHKSPEDPLYLLRNKVRGSHLQSGASRPGKRRLPSGSSAVTRSLNRDLTERTHGAYSVYSTSCWTVPVVRKGSGETEKVVEERCETPDWGPGDLALARAELEAFDLFYLIQGKQWGAQAAVLLQTVGN